jgi:hypothetical protein
VDLFVFEICSPLYTVAVEIANTPCLVLLTEIYLLAYFAGDDDGGGDGGHRTLCAKPAIPLRTGQGRDSGSSRCFIHVAQARIFQGPTRTCSAGYRKSIYYGLVLRDSIGFSGCSS